MTSNTVHANKKMSKFDNHKQVWLFGYGSLIFKTDFPFLKKQTASIKNWSRRFWQGSHDHRGTPDSPGRVVTLTPMPGAICKGIAYLITPEVFSHLDFREKNGYLRFSTEMTFTDSSTEEGLVYIANEENSAFLGPASELEIARHIARSSGPSGHNREYFGKLADALRELNSDDPHIFEIERHLEGLE